MRLFLNIAFWSLMLVAYLSAHTQNQLIEQSQVQAKFTQRNQRPTPVPRDTVTPSVTPTVNPRLTQTATPTASQTATPTPTPRSR